MLYQYNQYSFARTPFLAPAPITSVPTLVLTHFAATIRTCVDPLPSHYLTPAPTSPALSLTHFMSRRHYRCHTYVCGCAGLPRILELRGTEAQVRSARSLIHSILETEVG